MKTPLLLASAAACLFLGGHPCAASATEAAARAGGEAETANYPRAAEPMVKPALVALPPGAVEPAGWLRDWALAARDGITGHLDERHATFRDGWKGIRINSTGAEADGTAWPIEQCSYWLDGALRLGLVLHDEPLLKKIKARLDPIVDGVNGGSKTFIYWKKEMRPQGFNGWAHTTPGRDILHALQPEDPFQLLHRTRQSRILLV